MSCHDSFIDMSHILKGVFSSGEILSQPSVGRLKLAATMHFYSMSTLFRIYVTVLRVEIYVLLDDRYSIVIFEGIYGKK